MKWKETERRGRRRWNASHWAADAASSLLSASNLLRQGFGVSGYQVVASVHSWSIVTSGRMRSQFPNFFDLKLREAVSHVLPSFDCYGLGSVVRHLGVNGMADFASQQIHLSILSFDSSGQTASDAVSGAFGVIGAAQVVGDVASHIEHFTSHDNFLRASDRRVAALRPFHQQHGDTGRDEDRRSELTNARPIARKRARPSAHNFLR